MEADVYGSWSIWALTKVWYVVVCISVVVSTIRVVVVICVASGGVVRCVV